MSTAPIYVETRINHTVDEVWAHTQMPEVHHRWDVRFTNITYLEAVDNQPQRFVYFTMRALNGAHRIAVSLPDGSDAVFPRAHHIAKLVSCRERRPARAAS